MSDCTADSVTPRPKGLATAPAPLLGRCVLDGTLATPLLVLHEAALDWNIELMAAFCREHQVLLAPHAKTTMSAEIVRRQLRAGAWAVTVANVSQAIALDADAGRRVLIANEVVDAAGIAWLNSMLGNPHRTVYCYVDSMAGARRLAGGITGGALPVLLELGFPGGRAGVRTRAEALELAAALRQMPTLELVGVAGFEGFLGGTVRDAVSEARVRNFLGEIRSIAVALTSSAELYARDNIILSAGGSVYFDLVAQELTRPSAVKNANVVLRSGCYVTHDHGGYAHMTPLCEPNRSFRPAIEVLSTVLSRPEPGLAICDIGRRDVPFDAGLPLPLHVRHAADGGELRAAKGLELLRLNDQHGYLSVAGVQLEVGDIVSFGISHPCTAFDKWRVIPIVDDELRIVELAHTRF